MNAARVASPLFAWGNSKLAQGLRARRTAVEHLEAWARAHRNPDRPLVWLHAPSVGEGQQGLSVLRALNAHMPGLQTAYTWFSPSVEQFGLGDVGADVSGYLPWDLPGPVGRTLDALRPSMVVFTKTEVWPTVTAAARERGIPVALVAGTLRPGAGRSSRLGRLLLASSFSSLTRVCAIHRSDADALVDLGVSEAAVTVTGDPGVDAALGRAAEGRGGEAHLAPLRDAGGLVLVAGSTWPDDEAWLLDAVREMRARNPAGPIVVLAPHEPSAERVAGLVAAWGDATHPAVTLTELEAGGDLGAAATVVVDRLGALSQLYTVGDLAYVGGGIGRDGLHSVVEPATCALPIVHGPHYRASRIAEEMVEAGASQVAGNAGELLTLLLRLAADPQGRKRAGDSARAVLDAHRGASDRTAEALAAELDEPDALAYR